MAQRIAKDPRFERLPCTHKGTYADDCLVNRVTQVSVKIGSGGRWYQSDFSLAIACSIIMVAGSNVWSINDNNNEGVRDQGSPQRVLERCNTTLMGPMGEPWGCVLSASGRQTLQISLKSRT